MNRQLIGDALLLLQSELSPIAGIQLSLSPGGVEKLPAILEDYNLDYGRKLRLLGLCIILDLAAGRHMQCSVDHPDLVRNVLDGDYLYSFYLQFAIKHRELDLVVYLAPFIKRQQIARANGDFAEADYARLIGRFLQTGTKKNGRLAKAIEQVG